jgi:hypothetical protein
MYPISIHVNYKFIAFAEYVRGVEECWVNLTNRIADI